jgi:hypothetical protein
MPLEQSFESCVFQSNRLETFKSLLQKEFAAAHVQSLSVTDVTTAVNQGEDSTQFSGGEIRAALDAMMDANQLMVSDDRVFLI